MQRDMRTGWKPKLDATFPLLPKALPRLDEIFTLSASGDVEFTTSGQSQADLDAIGQGSVSHLKFLEHLKMMVR
jgi:hypothetical protein